MCVCVCIIHAVSSVIILADCRCCCIRVASCSLIMAVCCTATETETMPIKHIVLMKFKADTTVEALEKATANLLALKGVCILLCTRPCHAYAV